IRVRSRPRRHGIAGGLGPPSEQRVDGGPRDQGRHAARAGRRSVTPRAAPTVRAVGRVQCPWLTAPTPPPGRGSMPHRFLPPLLRAAGAGLIPAQPPEKSALERDPQGWTDLLPGPDLRGWKRVPIPPDKTLAAKNPWRVADGRLLCDGVGV